MEITQLGGKTELNGFDYYYYKSLAHRYFPYFFGKDFNLLTYSTKEDLLEKYKENQRNREYDYEYYDYYDIQRGYEYILAALNEYKTIKLTNLEVKNLWMAYNNLISEISNYHFYPKHEGSFGDIQNKTNEKLLFDISLFHINILEILKDAEEYLNTEKNEDNCQILIDLLNKLEQLLNDTTNELRGSRTNRETIIDNNNKNKYSELGKANKKWRLERNKAYQNLYYFYNALSKSAIINYITSNKQKTKLNTRYPYYSPKIDVLDGLIKHIKEENPTSSIIDTKSYNNFKI